MQDFPEFQNENMGGCQKFDFAPFPSIYSIPRTSDDVLSDDLTFKPNNTWLEGAAIFNTLEFVEEQNNSDAGDYFKTKISGAVPALTKEYLALFNQMKQVRHVVQITDNNGNIRMAGLNGGLKFAFSQDTKKNPSGANGFEFQFTGENPEPSPFVV